MKLRSAFALLFSALCFPALADVGFTSDRYSTVSGNASVQLQVRRDVAGPAITLGYRTVSGTAVPGADYVDQPSGTVTIPEDSTAPVSLSIPLLFNGNAQTRSFAVELTSTTGDVLSGFVRADVQILGTSDPANNAGIVRFPVAEEVLADGDLFVLSVSRENGSKGVATVHLTSTSPDGSYDNIDTTLTWNDGEVGIKSIPVHTAVPYFARSATITVPVQMTATGATIQGAEVATVYFLSPIEEPPVSARFVIASQVLGAATSNVSIGIVVPVDPDDNTTKLGYSGYVRGRTTDVLEGRDYIAEGDGALDIDENGNASINIEFPELSISDRQIEVILYRYGSELERTVLTLLGTENDPYFRTDADLNTGVFSMFGSETRLNNDAAAITVQVNRTGAAPLSAATIQYRLTTEDGVAGRDTASATDVGTISWEEGQVGSKAIIIPLIRTKVSEERRFTMSLSMNGSSSILASQPVVVLGTSSAGLDAIGFTSDLRIFPQESDPVVAFVERQGSGLGQATVQYVIEDGNTIVGLDYPIEAATGSLSWSDGEVGTKLIVIDRIARDPFQSKAFAIRLSGPGVISTSAMHTILVEALPLTFETAGQIQLERSLIVTDTNNGSISTKVQRLGGSQSAATAIVRTTAPDGSTSDRVMTWSADDASDRTVTISTTEPGEFKVEIFQVNGALKSDEPLMVQVADAGDGSSGGGAFGFEILPLALLGLWMRRRQFLAAGHGHA